MLIIVFGVIMSCVCLGLSFFCHKCETAEWSRYWVLMSFMFLILATVHTGITKIETTAKEIQKIKTIIQVQQMQQAQMAMQVQEQQANVRATQAGARKDDAKAQQ